jgi:hypothetical protein
MFRSGFLACTTFKVSRKQGIVGCGGSDVPWVHKKVCGKCPLFKEGLLDVL